jgi:hypothetical protein
MRRYPKASHKPGVMNKLEQDFAGLLQLSLRAGEIERWDFEPEKLRLADRTFYTPDFRVLDKDMTVIFYETKGFIRDDAAVKIKVAAEMHPYRFIMVHKDKQGWKYETIGREKQ